MKRLLATFVVCAAIVGGASHAAENEAPWSLDYHQRHHKAAQRFDQAINAAFIDAGTITVINLNAVTMLDAGAVHATRLSGATGLFAFVDAGIAQVTTRLGSPIVLAAHVDAGLVTITTRLNAADVLAGGVDAGTLMVAGVNAVVSSGSDAGITTQRIEMGRIELSGGGTATRTFTPAFSGAPVCVCSSFTAANACRPHTPTTTQVEFVGTASEFLNWICVGDK